jgi:hypothetical protein
MKPHPMKTHGEGHNETPEYRAWTHMKSRCYNPRTKDYPKYGGAGVQVCEPWRNSYENFLADMGRRPSSKHSVDRYPNPCGDYSQTNCRWATPAEQANNRRGTIRLTVGGETLTVSEWAVKMGMPRETLKARLYRMSPEEAISRPLPLTGRWKDRREGGLSR